MYAVHPHYLLFSSSNSTMGRTCRWQFVLESLDGTSRLVAADEEADAPSERGELLAVVRGLEALAQPSRVTLVTPSRYVSRGITRCLDDWRTAAWRWERFGRIEPIRDVDLWQRVDRAMSFHDVNCHAWPASEAESDPALCVARPDESADANGQPSAEPAVLIVRRPGARPGRAGILVRWAMACDAALAQFGASVAAALRCLVPAPRAT